jgi:thioredoxin-dependent peroxiredoxin
MSHKHLLNSKVPISTFKTRVRDEALGGDNPFKWQDLTTEEIFAGKKVIIFGLPGAFTPTCSSTHLPGYEKQYEAFKSLGIDEIYCLSVNDAFVMYQWAKNLGIEKVKMLPDGNGQFTKAMGMLVKKENLGFGDRSWRYSMVVNNSVIEELFVEANLEDNHEQDPFEVSDADTMMNYLKSK